VKATGLAEGMVKAEVWPAAINKETATVKRILFILLLSDSDGYDVLRTGVDD